MALSFHSQLYQSCLLLQGATLRLNLASAFRLCRFAALRIRAARRATAATVLQAAACGHAARKQFNQARHSPFVICSLNSCAHAVLVMAAGRSLPGQGLATISVLSSPLLRAERSCLLEALWLKCRLRLRDNSAKEQAQTLMAKAANTTRRIAFLQSLNASEPLCATCDLILLDAAT